MTLAPVKVAVSEHRVRTGAFPDDPDEIGLQAPDELPDYAELHMSADGILVLSFNPALMELFGRGTLQAALVPEFRDNAVYWGCFAGETAEDMLVYLPSSCRN